MQNAVLVGLFLYSTCRAYEIKAKSGTCMERKLEVSCLISPLSIIRRTG